MASLGIEKLPMENSPENLQKIMREGILLATGAVAILLQVANPRIARGVGENSNFANRPADRLRATMTYMYCMAFGTPEEKRIIIGKVHRVHKRVNGPGYTANNPELQLWVAATLYVAGVDLYEKIFGDLELNTADEVYKEYSIMATSLLVPPQMWPESREAFWQYWEAQSGSLEIGSHAKNIAKDLLYNKKAPLWIRVNLPIVRFLTAEWLPAPIREAYGLKTSKGRRRLYGVSMSLMRKVYPKLPVFVREYPVRYYLKDMRQRMKEEEGVLEIKA
ncbi:hypothetical protein N431DRAFT_427350 [Stipitochalara longipes BDJ]|nr:hypothetical protein N431DRAFT_427350 [Stipitochalara longipes BDJ]